MRQKLTSQPPYVLCMQVQGCSRLHNGQRAAMPTHRPCQSPMHGLSDPSHPRCLLQILLCVLQRNGVAHELDRHVVQAECLVQLVHRHAREVSPLVRLRVAEVVVLAVAVAAEVEQCHAIRMSCHTAHLSYRHAHAAPPLMRLRVSGLVVLAAATAAGGSGHAELTVYKLPQPRHNIHTADVPAGASLITSCGVSHEARTAIPCQSNWSCAGSMHAQRLLQLKISSRAAD